MPPQQPRTLKVGKGAGAGVVVLCSAALFAFLTKWESGPEMVLTAYADKLAHGIPTVCNGLTRHVTDTPIIVGETWTREKCVSEHERAITNVQTELGKCFVYGPPQSVFDAATSHAWNFGAPKTCGSAAMKAFNRREWELGCRRIQFADDGRPVWVYSAGKFIRGLANRRADEHRVCDLFERYDPDDPESIK